MKIDVLSIFNENPIDPTARLYWPYILTTVVLALVVFYADQGRKRFSVASFFRFLVPKSIYAHSSAILDYKVFFLNQLILSFFFLPLLLEAPVVARAIHASLDATFGSLNHPVENTWALRILLTTTIFVAADFGHFVMHYLFHRVPFLWRFHAVHHSAEVMTPLTLFRVHPVEPFLRSTSVGVFSGFAYGLFGYFFSYEISAVTILKINFFVFLFHVFGSNLRHSHVWISYPGFLGNLFISPAHHQIHHSVEERHKNRNFGNALAVWDWAIGTLWKPHAKEELTFGLSESGKTRYDLVSFYLGPVRDNLGAGWIRTRLVAANHGTPSGSSTRSE